MVVRRSFPASPESVAEARRFVRAALDDAGVRGQPADVAVLVVSELATNAVRHARTAYEVTLVLDGVLRLEVADGSAAEPRLRDPRWQTEGGRGLHLVDQLASHWGSEPTPAGKRVWWEDGPLG